MQFIYFFKILIISNFTFAAKLHEFSELSARIYNLVLSLILFSNRPYYEKNKSTTKSNKTQYHYKNNYKIHFHPPETLIIHV